MNRGIRIVSLVSTLGMFLGVSAFQLALAPDVGAATITLTITESAGDFLTVNAGGTQSKNYPVTSGSFIDMEGLRDLPIWVIDTTALPQNTFTFSNPAGVFYTQEPNPAFLNVVAVTGSKQLSVASDFKFSGVSPTFQNNNTSFKIGTDTSGNDINVVFIDNLTPDPSDAPSNVPEPGTLSQLLMSIAGIAGLALRRSRSI